MTCLRKYSAMKVIRADVPAMTYAQGYVVDSCRHGFSMSSAASGKMWTNPVASTTPPAKTVPKKKIVSTGNQQSSVLT